MCMELVVHRGSIIPSFIYKVIVISLSDDDHLINQIKINQLPSNWRTIAAYSDLQNLGSEWYTKQETLI